MTMYPFLTGFWTSAGASTAILFLMVYWRETHRHLHNLTPWHFTVISSLIYVLPLLAIGFVWNKLRKNAHRETTRFTLRRYFTGTVIGGIIIITVASLLLPTFRH